MNELFNTEISEVVEGSPVSVSEIVLDDTEIVLDGSENVEASTEVGSMVYSESANDTLVSIDGHLSIIMYLLLLSFCWSCMRSWRNSSIKGVK